MRLLVCFVIILLLVGCALAQPQARTLSGVSPSLRVRFQSDAQAPPGYPQAGARSGSEIFLTVDFAAARNSAVRTAAPPALTGLAAGRLFKSQGAEWQRHYDLGAATTTIAYALDDHRGGDRCWRAFAAGVVAGAAKELTDSYFDRRDFEATVYGAAITALLQGVMPRWEW